MLGFGSNSLTSARRGGGLENIRIWAIPPKRLVFWDDAPSPSRFGCAITAAYVSCLKDQANRSSS